MIYRRALLADHVEFVDPAEGYVVPGEETLYRLLCRLLGMKKCPLRVWRFSSKEYLNSSQILRSLGEPRILYPRFGPDQAACRSFPSLTIVEGREALRCRRFSNSLRVHTSKSLAIPNPRRDSRGTFIYGTYGDSPEFASEPWCPSRRLTGRC